nr:hypothetical protein [Tanacetum cinerariifolium]
LEGLDTWDGGKGTWGGQAKVFGTISVLYRCTRRGVGDGLFLAGKGVRYYVDKLGFIVRLFAENLLPDLAFLCGF